MWVNWTKSKEQSISCPCEWKQGSVRTVWIPLLVFNCGLGLVCVCFGSAGQGKLRTVPYVFLFWGDEGEAFGSTAIPGLLLVFSRLSDSPWSCVHNKQRHTEALVTCITLWGGRCDLRLPYGKPPALYLAVFSRLLCLVRLISSYVIKSHWGYPVDVLCCCVSTSDMATNQRQTIQEVKGHANPPKGIERSYLEQLVYSLLGLFSKHSSFKNGFEMYFGPIDLVPSLSATQPMNPKQNKNTANASRPSKACAL